MAHGMEVWAACHKEVITFVFTIALIITGIVSTIVAYLSMREIRRQQMFQEWSCLRNIHHGAELVLLEFKSRPTGENGRADIARSEAIGSLSAFLETVHTRITELEGLLGMSRNRG